jgi:chromosome segregation ATPase
MVSLTVAAETPSAGTGRDIYNPARTALINAQRQLAESSQLEKDILERVQRMHTELTASLDLLASAQQHDPSMITQIEALRSQLVELQSNHRTCLDDGKASLQLYDKLLADLQALIDHY